MHLRITDMTFMLQALPVISDNANQHVYRFTHQLLKYIFIPASTRVFPGILLYFRPITPHPPIFVTSPGKLLFHPLCYKKITNNEHNNF